MKQLDSEQQRVMDDAFFDGLYAAGAALLEYEARKAANGLCPFCGSDDITLNCPDDGYQERCEECLAKGPLKKTRQESAQAWRQRAARPAPAEGAKGQTQRFPIDRTDAYEERIDAERQAPRAESQDTEALNHEVENWMNRCEELQDQLADARRGYHSTEDVEKAIKDSANPMFWYTNMGKLLEAVRTRLTAQQGKETNHG